MASTNTIFLEPFLLPFLSVFQMHGKVVITQIMYYMNVFGKNFESIYFLHYEITSCLLTGKPLLLIYLHFLKGKGIHKVYDCQVKFTPEILLYAM